MRCYCGKDNCSETRTVKVIYPESMTELSEMIIGVPACKLKMHALDALANELDLHISMDKLSLQSAIKIVNTFGYYTTSILKL